MNKLNSKTYHGFANDFHDDHIDHPKWNQQRKSLGFDDTELWNLDIVFARFMLPRLIAFRENLNDFDVIEFDQILEGFQLLVDYKGCGDTKFFTHQDKENSDKINKALQLFASNIRTY